MTTDPTDPSDPTGTAAGAVAATCAGVSRHYVTPTGESPALRGVDAVFAAGTVTALTGPSGSGKSTLLALLAMRDRPDSGEVRLGGRNLAQVTRAERRRLGRDVIGWAPQRSTESLFAHLTARQHLEQAVRWRRSAAGAGGPGDVAAVLTGLGLDEVADTVVTRLSGGEQQRVALGCACVGVPALVLCDEPTAELDTATARLALDVLRSVAAAGSAVVVATHDPTAIAASDRVVTLRHGVVASEQEGQVEARAPIDPAGRVQLPPAALALFPDLRAVVRVEQDRVVLEPPPGRAAEGDGHG